MSPIEPGVLTTLAGLLITLAGLISVFHVLRNASINTQAISQYVRDFIHSAANHGRLQPRQPMAARRTSHPVLFIDFSLRAANSNAARQASPSHSAASNLLQVALAPRLLPHTHIRIYSSYCSMPAHQPSFLLAAVKAAQADVMDCQVSSTGSSDSDCAPSRYGSKGFVNTMLAPAFSSPSISPVSPRWPRRKRLRVQFAQKVQVEFTFPANEYDRIPIDPLAMTSRDFYEYQVMAFEMQQSIKFETTMRQLGLWEVPSSGGSLARDTAVLNLTKKSVASSIPSPIITPTFENCSSEEEEEAEDNCNDSDSITSLNCITTTSEIDQSQYDRIEESISPQFKTSFPIQYSGPAPSRPLPATPSSIRSTSTLTSPSSEIINSIPSPIYS